jgi:hypothetical protein
MKCAFCGVEIPHASRVGRQDSCPGCGRDLRCCKQCKFYDPRAYNECREVLAERVIDKERANFCDYFIVRGSSKKKVNRTEEAKRALEELFRKK